MFKIAIVGEIIETHFIFLASNFQLLFARGDLVELLISSNISRYAEFRAVDRIITCIENDMKVVPCSRADVFTNKNVTVLEKRLLMKALSSCLNEDNQEEFKGILHAFLSLHLHCTSSLCIAVIQKLMVGFSWPMLCADFEDKTFRCYLEHKRLTQNLIHYILYSIGMCDDQTLCLDGVRRVKKFLQSLGRYGNTPFLFPMYGCGEIPQCFCRLSAVFGGIYCLKRPITEIHLNPSLDQFHAIKCNDQLIRAKTLIISGTELNQFAHVLPKSNDEAIDSAASVAAAASAVPEPTTATPSSNHSQCGKLSRAIFIRTKPLCMESGSMGGGVEFLKLPPIGDEFAANGSECTGAFIIQLSHWSGTVPKDLCTGLNLKIFPNFELQTNFIPIFVFFESSCRFSTCNVPCQK